MSTDGTSALALQPKTLELASARRRSIFEMSDSQISRLQLIASMYVKSSMGQKSKITMEDAYLVMLKGLECGLEPMAAMDMIHMISGKPTISPQGMLALINASGELENISITDDGQACTVTMARRGRTPHTSIFSMTDAQRMKTTEWVNGNKRTISLSEKDNWAQQPATMRQWRAVAACCRVVFPDIVQGMYIPEEMDPTITVDEQGNMLASYAPPPHAVDAELVEADPPKTEGKTIPFQQPPSTATPAANVASAEHWVMDAVKRNAFQNECVAQGLGETAAEAWKNSLSTTLEPGKTLERLGATVLTFEQAMARLAELGNKLRAEVGAPPAAPAKPAKFAWDDDKASVLSDVLKSLLGRSMSQILVMEDHTTYKDMAAAISAAVLEGVENGWDIRATQVEYIQRDNKKEIVFHLEHPLVGSIVVTDSAGKPLPVRLFGGRTALKQMLDQAWYDGVGVEAWEPANNIKRTIPKVGVKVALVDDGKAYPYLKVTKMAALDPAPAVEMPL